MPPVLFSPNDDVDVDDDDDDDDDDMTIHPFNKRWMMSRRPHLFMPQARLVINIWNNIIIK
jgi:hypothetical protein